ncbi:patatin-like phospholipase family protein [Helicobacter jaachi]|uniref:Patatin-like phospholipase family protein n=1 Tax=Helicobacter jaachi TaxID=1677920 RepID=A0A4U8T7X8_9HELI|nr:patatin-like phospholipase family protein [Helicobacter jaachi]TLD95749.1 patatin-like phospholipase family protein [Helicobacter jaachi]
MKRAIVLGGGGSKGAYQIGAWRALNELGITYSIVTGTSIGSLNGVMMVQGHYERALQLWSEISIDKIVLNGLNLRTDFNYYKDNSDKLIPFIKSYANNKGMDIAPLKKLIDGVVDESFFTSPIDYGLVSVKFPSFAPVQKHKSQLTLANLALWVLASASCFPAFPVCEIDGENYIDGGYYDNLPINLAFELGAQEVIAIALNPDTHFYSAHPLVRTIQPIAPLGGMLDFDSTSISENIEIGYLDTLKSFGKLWGRAYSFKIDVAFMQRLSLALRAALAYLLHSELKETKILPLNIHKALDMLTPQDYNIFGLSPLHNRILKLLSMQSPQFAYIERACASEGVSFEVGNLNLYAASLNLIESVMAHFGHFTRDRIYTFEQVCDELHLKADKNCALNLQNTDKELLGGFFSLCLAYMP